MDSIPIPPLPFKGARIPRERITKQDIDELGAIVGCSVCDGIKDYTRAIAHSDRCLWSKWVRQSGLSGGLWQRKTDGWKRIVVVVVLTGEPAVWKESSVKALLRHVQLKYIDVGGMRVVTNN